AAGCRLGLVLLASFVITGRGLGASGAFASAAAGTVAAIAPARAQATPFFASYLREPGGAWQAWLIYEIAGVALGGALSAWLAGRLRRESEGAHRRRAAQRRKLDFRGLRLCRRLHRRATGETSMGVTAPFAELGPMSGAW